MNQPTEPNNELRDFIQETLRQVKEGVGEHHVHDQIHFKVAIAKIRSGEGKLGVTVLGLGEFGGKGEMKIEHASEVGFSVDLNDVTYGGVVKPLPRGSFDPSRSIR